MIYAILLLLILGTVYAPQLWVRYVLKHYHQASPHLPGTGGELAKHLLHRFGLESVRLEVCDADQDHYDPESNPVRLSPRYMYGKSLTAVAVAAHEVGHAIQFNRQEPVSRLRLKYLGHALAIKKIGTAILLLSPLIFAALRIPQSFAITILIGLTIMLTSVVMYAAILPEEWDASFNKALPILTQGEYISAEETHAVKRILKACALTYVAAALADMLSLWRWLLILRR